MDTSSNSPANIGERLGHWLTMRSGDPTSDAVLRKLLNIPPNWPDWSDYSHCHEERRLTRDLLDDTRFKEAFALCRRGAELTSKGDYLMTAIYEDHLRVGYRFGFRSRTQMVMFKAGIAVNHVF